MDGVLLGEKRKGDGVKKKKKKKMLITTNGGGKDCAEACRNNPVLERGQLKANVREYWNEMQCKEAGLDERISELV